MKPGPASKPWREAGLAAVVFLCAALWGGWYVAGPGHPMFYQGKYGPAAMLAMGQGFFNPDLEAAPALQAFLEHRAERVSSAELPDPVPALPEFDPMQLLYLYTQLGLAAVWAILGVSWTGVYVLHALTYGASAALAYGILRLGMRRPLAFILAGLFFLSPVQQEYLGWLRDYGKAPFFFALILLLGLLVTRRWRCGECLRWPRPTVRFRVSGSDAGMISSPCCRCFPWPCCVVCRAGFGGGCVGKGRRLR